MLIYFNPKIKTISNFDYKFDVDIIKNEPMIFSGDLGFARKNSGIITNSILDALEATEEFKVAYEKRGENNLVIDTRVNMVMPGQYPSIPGWHCDDVPRKDNNSQPDFSLCSKNTQHFMVLVSDKAQYISGTEFATKDWELDIDQNNVWNSLDRGMKDYINCNPGGTRFVHDGELIQFNQLAVHRASPAKRNGWRLFFRASITYRQPKNEIRNQVQVYVDLNNAGW